MAHDERNEWEPGPHDLRVPFIFVPHGAPDPVEWKAAHPEWVSFPATFVPRARQADELGSSDGGETAEAPAPGAASAWSEPGASDTGLDPIVISLAAMADPVGTLRRLGYDLSPDSADPSVVRAQYEPDERTALPSATKALTPAPRRPNAAVLVPGLPVSGGRVTITTQRRRADKGSILTASLRP